MKIFKIPQISFKGYDAAPLKRLYMHRNNEDGIVGEMKAIADEEKIELINYTEKYTLDKLFKRQNKNKWWAQDDKFILETKDSKPFLLREPAENFDGFSKAIKKYQGIDSKIPKRFLAGGNMFMGKNEKGEKWLLVGADEITRNKFSTPIVLDEISKIYDVKKENITILNQPDFHLDMAIRPIGYPYVLVNDPKLVEENLEKYKDKIPKRVFEKKVPYVSNLVSRLYTSCDETVETLEKAGFIPIRVAGNYTFDTVDINYMNAIVNKHQDGTISYITNSARNSDCAIFDEIFENDLRAAVKNIQKTHFVSGKKMGEETGISNPMMYSIKNLLGGIHCMTLEEPDFEKWGADENK